MTRPIRGWCVERAMRRRLLAATLITPLLLAACTRQSTSQAINAEQADQLNAIAANTSEDAGNDIAQNAAQTGDIGQAYRAGATAPPRNYR